MSRRAGCCLILLLATRPATAQNLGRLERMWKDAARASARVDSVALERTRERLDTTRAGNLLVLAPAVLQRTARSIADGAWQKLRGTYGDEIQPPHPPLVAAIYLSDKGPPPYGYPRDATPIAVPSGATTPLLIAQALVAIDQAIRRDFDKPLDRWLQEAVRTDSFENASPELYEDLVTSVSPLARGCYVGDLRACETALGLVPPHDAATEWYDAAGRREVVRHLQLRQSALADLCVGGGVDAACIQILHGPDSVWIAPPLMFASRELVVRTALQLGGPQAFRRLLASAGQPLGHRLELAAGVPLDSLLMRWHATVIATRPVSVDLLAGSGWVALVWALVLGTLVLRSTRWRI